MMKCVKLGVLKYIVYSRSADQEASLRYTLAANIVASATRLESYQEELEVSLGRTSAFLGAVFEGFVEGDNKKRKDCL